MKKKRQNGGVASTGFEKIEEFISNILKLILKIRRLSWDMPINMKKRLKFISALFIFGIPIMMYSMPESDAANAIIKYEQKYLMSPILGESYVSNLPMDNDESVFETNLLVELSKENGGGVIRNNPDYNSSKIYEIEPKQQIPFTGEKATGQSKGIVWYKVEYKKGHYGWISSNIVDVIKK
ncbi:SH3 domain-containing protein [Bacillus solimangrovi]|nr:SH3 domain-containing protein [Bacillus solimangrovi]